MQKTKTCPVKFLLSKEYLTGIVVLFLAIILLSGCSSPEKPAENQAKDQGYLGDMIDIKKKAEEDIQKAYDQTNNQLNNAMNESDINYAEKYSRATLETNLGKITLKFFPESAPRTVNNFLKLASEGFYDGTRFHRVIKDFMIQGGDPLSKDDSKKSSWGTGGPGYKFNDELSGQEKYNQGTLAMANAGPNTNGSQFFIVTASPGYPLPPSYTVFGEVSEGLETALKIQNVETDPSDRPLQDVTIEKIDLIEKK